MKPYRVTRRYRIWAYWMIAGIGASMMSVMFEGPEWLGSAVFLGGFLISIVHTTVDWLRFQHDG